MVESKFKIFCSQWHIVLYQNVSNINSNREINKLSDRYEKKILHSEF